MKDTPAPTPSPSNPPPLPATEPPQTSGLAITSLILGLLGFLILPAIGGVICGLVAHGRIRRSNGRLKGGGLALAGIIVSGVMLALVPVMAILAGLLLPALAQAKSKAQVIMSMNNVRQLGLAVHLYADDSNGRFPAPGNWCDLLQPYTGGNARVFQRPADQQGPVRSSYGFNARVSASKIGEVDKATVLVFELQTTGWNVSGGPELLRQPRNARDPVIVGFADGHAEAVSESRLRSLRWNP